MLFVVDILQSNFAGLFVHILEASYALFHLSVHSTKPFTEGEAFLYPSELFMF